MAGGAGEGGELRRGKEGEDGDLHVHGEVGKGGRRRIHGRLGLGFQGKMGEIL